MKIFSHEYLYKFYEKIGGSESTAGRRRKKKTDRQKRAAGDLDIYKYGCTDKSKLSL